MSNNNIVLQLPKHKSVVVTLNDSDDSESDGEASKATNSVFGGLESMIKEARRTAEVCAVINGERQLIYWHSLQLILFLKNYILDLRHFQYNDLWKKYLCFQYLNNEASVDYINFTGLKIPLVSNYALFKIVKWVHFSVYKGNVLFSSIITLTKTPVFS